MNAATQLSVARPQRRPGMAPSACEEGARAGASRPQEPRRGTNLAILVKKFRDDIQSSHSEQPKRDLATKCVMIKGQVLNKVVTFATPQDRRRECSRRPCPRA